MEYLVCGSITKTIGLKGEVRVYPKTDFRDSRFKVGNHLFLSNGKDNENLIEVTIRSHRKQGELDVISFKEYPTIESVTPFVGFDLLVIKDKKILKKDEYFYSDLMGMEVYFDNGTFIGKVKKIEEYASYRTLRVARDEGKDVLIPFVNAMVKDVNLEEKKITVNYIDGLL